jgi:hypothetical protein
MNERIRELIEQSGYTKGHHDEYGRLTVMPEFNKEKFAELIVRECIKESMEEIVADEEIAREKDPLSREYLRGNNQGIVDAVVRFRNHFGVEE